MSAKAKIILALVLGGALLGYGCDPAPGRSIGITVDGDRIQVAVSPCDKSAISSLEFFEVHGKVYGDRADRMLWAITAKSDAVALRAVTIGELPPGYSELHAVEVFASDSLMAIVLSRSSPRYNRAFVPAELRQGQYLVAGKFVSKDDFEACK